MNDHDDVPSLHSGLAVIIDQLLLAQQVPAEAPAAIAAALRIAIELDAEYEDDNDDEDVRGPRPLQQHEIDAIRDRYHPAVRDAAARGAIAAGVVKDRAEYDQLTAAADKLAKALGTDVEQTRTDLTAALRRTPPLNPWFDVDSGHLASTAYGVCLHQELDRYMRTSPEQYADVGWRYDRMYVHDSVLVDRSEDWLHRKAAQLARLESEYRLADVGTVRITQPDPDKIAQSTGATAALIQRIRRTVESCPDCPDCRGTGVYVGLFAQEPCRTCGGKGGT